MLAQPTSNYGQWQVLVSCSLYVAGFRSSIPAHYAEASSRKMELEMLTVWNDAEFCFQLFTF